MKNNLRKKYLYGLMTLALAILFINGGSQSVIAPVESIGGNTVVIDAGHGGPDGGATSTEGVSEKDINLAVAKELEKELLKQGYNVVMTRQDDLENLNGQWDKSQDMRNRRECIEKSNASVVISIHLNSFPQDSKVHGAQVFFGNEKSKPFADHIQRTLIEIIDDGSQRVAMKKDDMYIFETVDTIEILVECGFLSNPDDAKRLQSLSFQRDLAMAIATSFARFDFLRTNIF